jgi:putative transposase
MPRPPRQLVDGGYYHLMGRGNNRLSIFLIEEGFNVFKSLLRGSKKKFPWKLLHYCLMSNHIHLLAQLERGTDLPLLMQYLLFQYSLWYRKQTTYVGHLWQGRYKSPLINDEPYLLECGRYIERNPVRAGIVGRLEDYPWSSYRYYAFGEPDPLVEENPYFIDFGRDRAERERHYREFVKLDRPYDQLVDNSFLKTYS